MRILALNPGSSSLKAALRTSGAAQPVLSTLVERVGTDQAIGTAVDRVADEVARAGPDPDVVSHRVVHGGPKYQLPVVVDDAVVSELWAVIPLAPLHLPGALETMAHARRRWPAATHVACFDTGFHRDLPEVSRRLPVADELNKLGVRRYGFHGLSVQSVLLARPDLGDVVIAHLGSGCSVTAVASDGRPRHTTMSFTPTAGMMSATRTGDIDPEIALYLIEHHGYDVERLRDLFDRRSGLAGIAQGRSDIRDLSGSDDASAALALDMFVANAAMAIAASSTTLDGWDSLVFTGGVGEHAEDIRSRICVRLRLTGVAVQAVPADEERVLDLLARELVSTSPR